MFLQERAGELKTSAGLFIALTLLNSELLSRQSQSDLSDCRYTDASSLTLYKWGICQFKGKVKVLNAAEGEP